MAKQKQQPLKDALTAEGVTDPAHHQLAEQAAQAGVPRGVFTDWLKKVDPATLFSIIKTLIDAFGHGGTGTGASVSGMKAPPSAAP